MLNPSAMLKSLDKEAHVWTASTDIHYDSKLLSWYESLLSDDEHSKYNDLRFSHHRKTYLISHSLLRTVLSRYKSVPPEEWRFSYDSFGRPEIRQPYETPNLNFSITRTRGKAACLISSSSHVGVDLECTLNLNDPEIMFKHVLVAEEIASLKGLCGNSLIKGFLVYWTLKEAYVKALGKGLSIPLTQFSFKITSNGEARIGLNSRLKADSGHWQFAFYWLTKKIILAVALCNSETFDNKVRLFEVIPGFEHNQCRA